MSLFRLCRRRQGSEERDQLDALTLRQRRNGAAGLCGGQHHRGHVRGGAPPAHAKGFETCDRGRVDGESLCNFREARSSVHALTSTGQLQLGAAAVQERAQAFDQLGIHGELVGAGVWGVAGREGTRSSIRGWRQRRRRRRGRARPKWYLHCVRLLSHEKCERVGGGLRPSQAPWGSRKSLAAAVPTTS